MKVSEVLSSFDDCLKRNVPVVVRIDEKDYSCQKGDPLVIGNWQFVLQGNYEEGYPGFLARTEGARVIWVYKEGIRRGDGSINGTYCKDVVLACKKWMAAVFL